MQALLQPSPAGVGSPHGDNNRRMRVCRPPAAKRGGTLVETMVACVLLAVLAIAGVSALYQTGSGLAIQKQRRIALGLANSRLEELRSAPYAALTALIALNYNTNAIRKTSGQFVLGSGETVSMSGKLMPVTTTLQYADADGGSASYDMLRLTASVQYRSAGDVVTLQTLRSPW